MKCMPSARLGDVRRVAPALRRFDRIGISSNGMIFKQRSRRLGGAAFTRAARVLLNPTDRRRGRAPGHRAQ